VTSSVAGFVLPLGLDINLDGSGVYYPLAVLFLVSRAVVGSGSGYAPRWPCSCSLERPRVTVGVGS
jgi:hypothetical protein